MLLLMLLALSLAAAQVYQAFAQRVGCDGRSTHCRQFKSDDSPPATCPRCPNDWQQVKFVGVGPRNQSDVCALVDTCAKDVAHCDFTQPPDQVFATCTGLSHVPTLVNFTGGATGAHTSAWYINSTVPNEHKAFVLFIAPQLGADFSGWACSYVFSYLATQGIATFVATIPNSADADRDNWNRVPSADGRPYPYTCSQLNRWGPGCDNSSNFLHDRHIDDVLMFAGTLGYNPQRSVWWGFSEGGAMASAHLNYKLHRSPNGWEPELPRAIVLESTGGQYCYAFRPGQEPALKSTPFWNECVDWSNNNCCPKSLTEQYFFEHSDQWHRHPPVLLVGGNSDSIADPNGVQFYHDTMRHHAAPSATATWDGYNHGISPLAFGFAASYVKNALLAPM